MVSFNPIWYETITEYGNKYTKFNIGKSVALVSGEAYVTLAACNKLVKLFEKSPDKIIANFIKGSEHKGNLSSKAKYAIN